MDGERHHVLDNARGIVQPLVIIGHFILRLQDHDTFDTGFFTPLMVIMRVIWLIDMPLFAFLSGSVSDKPVSEIRARRMLQYLAMPWKLTGVVGVPFGYPFMASLDGFWYLGSLLVWRTSTPMMLTVKRSILLLSATALSLTWPLWLKSYPQHISWAFEFLPFYILGLLTRPHHLRTLQDATWRLTLLPPISILVAAAYVFKNDLGEMLHLLLVTRDGIGTPLTMPSGSVFTMLGWLLLKFTLYVIACSFIVSLLAVLPCGESYLTACGRRGMFSYILHGFIVVGIQTEGLRVPSLLWAWFLTFWGAIPLWLVLTSEIVASLTSFVLAPTWLNFIFLTPKSDATTLH